MTDQKKLDQQARIDAQCANAWKPTPKELAELILIASRPKHGISRSRGQEWSFWQSGWPQHVCFCSRTGYAHIVDVTYPGGHPKHSNCWATKTECMRVLGLVEHCYC